MKNFFLNLKSIASGVRSLRSLFLILFLSVSIFASAQIDNNFIRVKIFPDDVVPCDTSWIKVELMYKSTKIKGLQIEFQLPAGVTYVNNSFSIYNNPGNIYNSTSPGGTPNAPVFTIVPSGGGDAKLGDIIRFKFAKIVGCDALSGVNAGQLFKDIQIVQLNHNGSIHSFSNINPNVSNYQVLIPALGIQSIPAVSAIVGQTISRNVTVVQGGTGHLKWFVHKVTLGSEIGNYQLSYNGTALTPDSVAGNEYFYYVHLDKAPYSGTVGNGDALFENGETVTFKESFQVQGCNDVDVVHRSAWGCSLADICRSSSPESGSINFEGATPEITMTKIAGDDYVDLCGGQTFTIRIENIATSSGAMAKDLKINFGLGHNSSPLSDYGYNPLWAFDWRNTRNVTNVLLNGNPVPFSNWASTVYPSRGSGNTLTIPHDFFTTDPDGPGGLDDIDGDGYYDDLAPGEHLDVTFQYGYTLRTNCGEKRFDYVTWEHLYIDALYKDQCGNEKYAERLNFDYSNIIRDYLNETIISAPNNVSDGEQFTVGIKPHFYSNGWSGVLGRVRCNGQNVLNGPGVTWTVELTVPPGVSLSPSAPAGFSQSGNTITYTQQGYDFKFYNFPLVFDCASYSGGQYFNIDYKTHYHCSCWDADIHCGTIKIQNLCPTACKGPTTIKFDSHRTVAGWTDNTKTTKVDLSTLGMELDNYMALDTMEVEAVAVIHDSTVANLFLDLDYQTQPNGGDENLFTFIDGDIEIDDISSGTFTGTITSPPAKTVVGPNQFKYTFDLSSFTTLVSPAYQYGEGNQDDTVTVKLRFVLNDANFDYRTFFKLEYFKGNFYSKNGASINSCQTLSDQVRYLKPQRIVSNWTDTKTWYCEPTEQRNFFSNYSDAGDIFPSEFRNPITLDSAFIVLPKGVKFSGEIHYFNYNTSYNPAYTDANGGLTYSLVGDTLKIYPGPNFEDMDQRGTCWPRFRPVFIGTCEADSIENYEYTVYYHEFAYVMPQPKSQTAHPKFEYYRPQFDISSPHPVVTVIDNEPYMDVQVCNLSPVDIDYNWVRVDNGPDFTVTKAFILDNAGNEVQPANFTTNGNTTWVEMGQITTGASNCKTVRIYGTIGSCNDQTITVSSGWDCLAYPSDYSTIDSICYRQTMDIQLSIQEAQAQVDIVTQPDSITYCDPFLLSLEVNSAQIGNLLNPYLLIGVPSGVSSMAVDSIVVEYPKGSGNKQTVPFTVSGTKLRIDLNGHPAIAADGMLGSYLESTDSLRLAVVDIYLALDCSFLNLSTIDVQVFGLSPCNQPAIGNGTNVTSGDILVQGVNVPYYMFSEMTSPDTINGCNTLRTIEVKSTVIGGTTGTVDSTDITIPVGLSFVPGSFACTSPHCATLAGTYSAAGQEHLIVALPQGVGHLDSVKYSFDVVTSNSYCSNKEYFDIESYIYTSGGACGAVSCGAEKVPTGQQRDSLAILKPDLVVLGTSQASYMTTSTGETYYGLSYAIQNVGINATAGYDFTVYCADASGNPASVIYTGSFPNVLLSGDSLAQTIYFTSATACDPANGLVFEIVPSAVNCLCAPVTASIPLNPGMDAKDDHYTTPEDTPLSDNVTANDNPNTGVVVNTAPLVNTTHGTLTLNSDGTFTYVPNPDYFGPDSFVYEVCDTGNPVQCDTATAYITVTPVNDPPIAVDDSFYTDINVPLTTANVLNNDSDPEGDVLTVNTTPLNGPANGTLTLNGDGSFVYTPNFNFYGYDQFDYVVCDNGSPSLCDTATVKLKIGTINVIIAQADTLDCITPAVTLDGTASSQGSVFTIQWNTTNGNIVSGSNTLTPVVDRPGEYWLILTDTVSNNSDSAMVTVVIDTLAPNAVIVSPHDAITCKQSSVFLSGSGSGTGHHSYQWTTTGGAFAGNTNGLIVEATQVGDYTLVVTDNDNGCTASASTTVVYDTVSPAATIAPPADITCANACVDLDATGSDAGHHTYQWTTANGVITSGDTTLQPVVCATGTYSITVTDELNGCTSSAQVTVGENKTPPPVAATSTQPITCSVQSVYIEATVASGGSYAYAWSPQSAIVNGDTTSNPLVNQPTTYTVTVTDNANGCTGTASVEVVTSTEVPIINLATPDTLTCKDTLVSLNVINLNPSFQLAWSTSDGNIVSGDTTATPVVSAAGTYSVTVTNAITGCTSEKTVDVLANVTPPVAAANNVLKPDCASSLVQIGDENNANMDNVSFHWTTQNGHFASSPYLPNPIVDKVGTYVMTVTGLRNGCVATDSVEVTTTEPLTGAVMTTQLPGCNGNPGAIVIDSVKGSEAPFEFSFDGGTNFGTMPIASGLYPGEYEVVIKDMYGCEFRQTVVLPVPEGPEILFEPDVTLTIGDSTVLEVFTGIPVDAIDTIVWEPLEDPSCQDLCFAQTVRPLETTVYSVTITDTLGCVARALMTVHVKDSDVYIPNVFSPNDGDGQNDFFTVMGENQRIEEVVTMQIFDRWGNHVFGKDHFPINDFSQGWDGTFRGKPVSQGTYIYFVRVKFVDGSVKEYKGDINVVR